VSLIEARAKFLEKINVMGEMGGELPLYIPLSPHQSDVETALTSVSAVDDRPCNPL
jgi:hypothetical protein